MAPQKITTFNTPTGAPELHSRVLPSPATMPVLNVRAEAMKKRAPATDPCASPTGFASRERVWGLAT